MPKEKSPRPPALLAAKLTELTELVGELAPDARVEIVAERYEDEDAAVDVYLPPPLPGATIGALEQVLGQRCNDILVDTGLFIIGAVREEGWEISSLLTIRQWFSLNFPFTPAPGTPAAICRYWQKTAPAA